MKWIMLGVLLLYSCQSNKETPLFSELPDGAQARALTGELLFASSPYQNTAEKFELARKAYERNRDDADSLIWYGRWTAYTGDYRQAIEIYTTGIRQFPKDARLYRHRGHRYISIREFDRAIADFEAAVKLIEGRPDQVEPDGQPNAQNIPVSSLHTNIWYHLGLARYLKQDWVGAIKAYEAGLKAVTNDDMMVAFLHWKHMAHRMMGDSDSADAALAPIHSNMHVIESFDYYKLCRFYKGLLTLEEIQTGKNGEETSGSDGLKYGIANWYAYNGQLDKADAALRDLVSGKIWASFGHIAAEAQLVIGK